MKKRITAVILCLCILLPVLTGCNGSKGKKDVFFDSTNHLTNENATKEARVVYNYILQVYGNSILTGQQESTWEGGEFYEVNYIEENTGKKPAILGLDFMNDDFYGCVKRAKSWWKQGGIVTICWHCGSDFFGSWDEAMDSDVEDWDAMLTEGTPEYQEMIKGMDKAAKALSLLQDEGIPVLWRPFHEMDGGWFWWGKGWAEKFKKLWTIMYERYTNHWELNNLIWVLGYSTAGMDYTDWYPGDEYVDIAGADSYGGGAQASMYRKVKDVVEDRKPICFHECGTNPTVEELASSGAKWCYFMTWHTNYLTQKNEPELLKELYNSDYAITLDELPAFTDEQKNTSQAS